LGVSYNRNILFSYLGGPGSVYGVGSTEIKRTEDTTTLSSPVAMSYDQIMSGSKPFAQGEDKHSNGSYAGSYLKTSLGDVVDYRKNTENASNAWGGKSGTGTLKDTLVYNFFIKKEKNKMKDKMNLLNLIYFNNSVDPWTVPDFFNGKKDIIKSIESGNVCKGKYVYKLERMFERKFDVKHAIACNTCTSGLIIALKVLYGGEYTVHDSMFVGLPAFTWFSTGYAVECNGLEKEWFDTAASGIRHFPGTERDQPVSWLDPAYTFNTSCHSCHVSQLAINYDLKTDTYATTWAEPASIARPATAPVKNTTASAVRLPKEPCPGT
jgi:hypothetical protein